MIVLEVLIEYGVRTLNRPFTYVYYGNKSVDKGFRVLVSFNNKEIVGYVINKSESEKTKEQLEEELGFKIFEINDVLDNAPLLNDELLSLADNISSYYLCPKIRTLQTMLPPSLKPMKSSLTKPKIAYDQFVVLKDEDEEDLTPKQIELLRLIKKEKEVSKKDFPSPSILKKLIDLGRLEIILKEKERLVLPTYKEYKIPELTLDQKKVIEEFNNSNDDVYLLEGVTGSGKTEVYLALCDQVLKQNKTIIMLVPEISLTPMMMEIFIKRFKDDVAILHSSLTPAEKYDEYRKIANGKCKVVIGARSAIFAPLKNIGLIILDEEHSESYKQENNPHYHAREVAIMRLKYHKAKLLLGSATPSLETRARAQKGIFHLLKLDKRVNNSSLPPTVIVSMSDYRNIDRESYIFSKRLREEMKERLNKKEQIILLLNRRGFSSSLLCRSCGHVFKCPTCGIPLTYHKEDKMLKCHHCGYVEIESDVCPECGNKYLMKVGFGTERIEDEVNRLFPLARVLRLDSDSAKVRQRIQKTIEAFQNEEADILIGTQMVAKGHDFPNVTLVGVVLADIGLSMPSYRSNERAFQLITQAVGRSGRKDKPGKAIIQTYQPTNYAITYAARQNYEAFYQKEMTIRKLNSFPPYYYMSLITLSSKNEDTLIEASFEVARILKDEFNDDGIILGPSNPFIPHINDTYKKVIYVKFKNKEIAHDILKKLVESYTQISIDIDFDSFD